MVLIQPSNSQ